MQAHYTDATDFAACPRCKAELAVAANACTCRSPDCGRVYPVVRGLPILIVEERSIFRWRDYQETEAISLGYRPRRSIVSMAMQWVPSLTENRIGVRLYADLLARLRQAGGAAPKRVLVIGAGDAGEGVEALRAAADVLVVETDVYFAGNVAAIADGHDLPFGDASFDAVVLQAVLEHVADPWRCVHEAHRVLRSDGLVYAETPFLFPVHLGAYDFHRFSLAGHRRLFRMFGQIEGGIVAGAGTALALAVRSFFLTLRPGRVYQAAVRLVVPFFVFWLKYVDRLTVHRQGTADFACTLYFFGRKAERPVSDADIIDAYARPP